MQHKTIAVLLTFLLLGVAIYLTLHRERSVRAPSSPTASSSPLPTSAPPTPHTEGCRIDAYTGKTPLQQVPYYVAGTEDIRGGITCMFRVNPKLPMFAFHFPGREDNSLGSLEITSGTSAEVLQTIEYTNDANSIEPAKAENVLTMVDANFDGYQDLQLLTTCGAKTCTYNFYLYDPKANRFVLETFLSGFSSPVFDPAKKQVSQGWLLSMADSAGETYQYENGRYTLIRREESTWNRQAHTVTHDTYELRNGQMELVDSKTTPTD